MESGLHVEFRGLPMPGEVLVHGEAFFVIVVMDQGDRFAGGVVLCACDDTRTAGDRICVAPVSMLGAR